MNFLLNLQILAANPFVVAWEAIKTFLANCIEWFFNLTLSMGIPSYILAIFLFTIIVKVLTQPLQSKQLRSTRRIQMLKPEVDEIKKRYASDPQKQQQLTMALYKEHNASPMAGCLPLLIQMPILIALFTTLRQFGVEGSAYPVHPEFFNFWVWDNLAMPINETEGLFHRLLLPVLVALSQLLQQLVTATNLQDRQQKLMLLLMPLMFMFITQGFPVLLAFYWIFYSLIGAAITYPILKHWKKVDQAAIDAKRAAKEAEEEEKRAKREAARERNRNKNKKTQQHKKANYETKAGDIQLEEGIEEDAAADEEAVEEEDLSYLDELEDEEREAILAEREKEERFQAHLKERNFTIKKKRMKLHPYDSEAVEVELVVDERGQEMELAQMRKRFFEQQGPQGMPNMSLSDVFGFGKKKKKTQAEAKQNGQEQPEDEKEK